MEKTLEYLIDKKRNKRKITALTSYDYPTTVLLEAANIDMIILGDSVGTNILGYENETQVTMDDMIHHTRAVCRAKKDIFLVVDLPYNTHETPEDAVRNAAKLVDIGADAVKFEGIKENIVTALKNNSINVMCHVGLNPQYDQDDMKHGKISKGKVFDEAVKLIEGSRRLENAGADLIILEKIPEKISGIITHNLNIPTIGIGAGKYCDGQVLIINDLLGISEKKYKHVPGYGNLRRSILEILDRYREDTEKGTFPAHEHINIIKEEEYQKVEKWCMENKIRI